MTEAIDFIKKLQNERTDYNHISQVRTLTNSLLQLSTGIYTEPERFVYELLQNAVDAFADTDGDTLEILIKMETNKLFFFHNGKPFLEKDVEGICDVGNGTKSKDSKKIGYKGIGFKSVFMPMVKRVSIKSGDFCFMFDQDEATRIMPTFPEGRLKPNEVPWQVIPILQPDLKNFDLEGFNVATIVEMADEKDILNCADKIEELFNDLQFLLFLRNRNVNIRFETEEKLILSIGKEMSSSEISPQISSVKLLRNNREQSSWLIYSGEIVVPADVKNDIANDFNTPDKLKGAELLEISFATRLEGGKLKRLDDTTVFTFLPTSYNNLKEPFLINANFITDAGRQQLHQGSEWNKLIFGKIPEFYLDFVAKIAPSYPNYADVLPERFPGHDTLTDVYRKALAESLATIAFVPTQDNSGKLKIVDVIIDQIGVFDSVISSQQILDYLAKNNNKLFATSNIVTDKGIITYAHDLVSIIDYKNLIILLGDSDNVKNLNAEMDGELVNYLYNCYCNLDKSSEATELQHALQHIPFLMNQNLGWDCPLDLFFPSDFKKYDELTQNKNFLNKSVLAVVEDNVELISWLRNNLGVRDLDEIGLVDFFLSHPDYITLDNVITVGNFLFEAWKKENFLDSNENRKRMCELNFLSMNGELVPISNLYLGSYYKPEDNIETVYPDKSIFISDNYAVNYNVDDWSFFFKKCGITYKIGLTEKIVDANDIKDDLLKQIAGTFRDKPHSFTNYFGYKNPIINIKFSLHYFCIIDPLKPDYQMDKFVLSKILSKKVENSEETDNVYGRVSYWGENIKDSMMQHASYDYSSKYKSYLEYVIANIQRFPTTLGTSELSENIYLNSEFNKEVGGKYLPVLNIDAEIHDSWLQLLPFKHRLTTQDLLNVLEQISEDKDAKKEEIRERVSKIYRELIDRNQQKMQELATWGTSHKLRSDSGSFLNPSELTYITVSGFKSGKKVYCEKVGLEYHEKLLLLLKTFGVKVITKDDIHPKYEGDYECNEIKIKLQDKLQYLALLKSENISDFDDCKAKLNDKISKSIFYRCRKISLTYGDANDVLQKQTFAQDGNFYYVGDFTAAKVEPLLTPLCSFLSLKGVESELMVILLTNSHNDLVDFFSDKGYNVSYLEATKATTRPETVVFETTVRNDIKNENLATDEKEQETGQEESGQQKESQQYTTLISDFLNGYGELDKDHIFSENQIVRYRVLRYLWNNCYSISSDFDEKEFVMSGDFKTIPLTNGTYIAPQGARYGIWYISPNIWQTITDGEGKVCLCTGENDNDFMMINSKEAIEKYVGSTQNVLLKISKGENYGIMDAVESVFPGDDNWQMNVHLMVMVHHTKNVKINGLFNVIYKNNRDNDYELD